MLGDGNFHKKWCDEKLYGGLNQAALGYLLESQPRIKTLELPCQVWNAVNGCWRRDQNPKVVHVMSSLRDWCLNNTPRKSPDEQWLVDTWQRFHENCELQKSKCYSTA